MADGQHLLCSVFLQRLRWSAYRWLDLGSSGYTEPDADIYGDCYGYSDRYRNAYVDASAESYTNYDCERNTDFYSTT